MSDILKPADTPKEQLTGTKPEVKGTTPPAAPKDTPADKSQQGDNNVTLTKEEHNQLKKQAAIAASSQRKADRLEKLVGRRTKGGVFSEKQPPEQIQAPTPEELNAQGIEEDRKAEKGLMGIAIDPKYRKVLDDDTTLRDMFSNNPLGVLPLYAPNALDAEEALDMVKEKLDSRLEGLPKEPANTDEQPAGKTEEPAIPPAGGVNVAATGVESEMMEQINKMSNTDDAAAKMIGHKIELGRK